MYFRITTICAFIAFSFALFSQTPKKWNELLDDPEVTLTQLRVAFEQEWTGKVRAKGQGYNQFKRFEYFAAPRVYPSDKIGILKETYFEHQIIQNQKKSIPSKSSKVWKEVGPNTVPTQGGGAGRLTFIEFHPNNVDEIYVGTPNGGLWKSMNGGVSWTNSNDYLSVIGCSDLEIDPTDPNVMYLATGDNDHVSTSSVGVLKSTNGGATWISTGLTFNRISSIRIFKMIMHPTDPNILIAATTSGIKRTGDGGATWSDVSSGNYRDLEVSPANPSIWYASTTNQFKKSTDGGLTWTVVTSGLPSNTSRIAIAISGDEPNNVWAIASNDDHSLKGIYKSSNDGESFTMITDGAVNMLDYTEDGSGSGGQAWYDLAIGVNPLNSNEIWIGGINTWKTMDGGANWEIQSHWYGANGIPYVHADIHDIQFLPNSNEMVILCDGGMFKTINSGVSFLDLSDGLSISQQYLISQASMQENLLLAGHQDNGTNRIAGSGNWTRVLGGDGMACLIDRDNNNRMIASYQYGAHNSSFDGGNSFQFCFEGLQDGAWVSPIHQDITNPDRIYALGRSELIISNDFGFSYSEVSTGQNGTLVEMSICKSNPDVFYLIQGTSGSAKIMKTIDKGATFTNVTGNLTTNATKVNIVVDPNNPDHVFVVYSGFDASNKVWKSTNGGASWTNISTGLPNVPCNVLFIQDGTDQHLYLGNDLGVYFRDSITNTWEIYGDSLPNTEVTDLDFYYPTNTLIASTYGRGIWRVKAMNDNTIAPVAAFTSSNTTICKNGTINFTDQSTNGPATYFWKFQGGSPATSTVKNPTVQYFTLGIFDVELTVTNSAGSDTKTSSDVVNVQSCAGLDEETFLNMNIFPNPAKDVLTIEANRNIQKISLMDICGKEILLPAHTLNETKILLQLPSISKGIYTLQIESSGVQLNKLIVIE